MIVEMIGHCQHMIRCPTAEIDFVHYNTVHLIQKKTYDLEDRSRSLAMAQSNRPHATLC